MLKQNSEKVKTVVTSHVQYSTGYRQDLEALGEITTKNGFYFVVNSTQSLGALQFNVKDFAIDFMVSNGHKWMLSSFGIGVLYIKKKYLRDAKNLGQNFLASLARIDEKNTIIT